MYSVSRKVFSLYSSEFTFQFAHLLMIQLVKLIYVSECLSASSTVISELHPPPEAITYGVRRGNVTDPPSGEITPAIILSRLFTYPVRTE
jgi:hypothetical protein